MFGLFRRTPAAPGRRRARPALEALEARDCPAAPQVTFTVTEVPGHMVRLSGTVTDENPATVTVAFSGVVSGMTMADPTGHFSLPAQPTTLGLINAVARDQEGLTSDPAQVAFTSAAPTITLTIAYGPQRSVILAGKVTDESPGGRPVTFTGAASGTALTNADGTFSVTLVATQLGNVQAVTTDVWGLSADAAVVTVANTAPVISDFTGNRGSGNVWTFGGKVTDEAAVGLTVRFGGLASLQDKTATVQADGWFWLSVVLAEGEDGTALARATDWWGVQSDEAWFDVRL
jgi:hypothetical protein